MHKTIFMKQSESSAQSVTKWLLSPKKTHSAQPQAQQGLKCQLHRTKSVPFSNITAHKRGNVINCYQLHENTQQHADCNMSAVSNCVHGIISTV